MKRSRTGNHRRTGAIRNAGGARCMEGKYFRKRRGRLSYRIRYIRASGWQPSRVRIARSTGSTLTQLGLAFHVVDGRRSSEGKFLRTSRLAFQRRTGAVRCNGELDFSRDSETARRSVANWLVTVNYRVCRVKLMSPISSVEPAYTLLRTITRVDARFVALY